MNRSERDQMIVDLLAAGYTPKRVADKLGVSASTVRRVIRIDKGVAAPDKRTPGERLAELRNGFLSAAEEAMTRIAEMRDDGKDSQRPVFTAKLATEGAILAQQQLDRSYELPLELPTNDEDARRVILNGWWLAASRGGSSTAMTKLAHAYGIRTAARQPVSIAFERPKPSDAEHDAPTAPAVPREGRQLH